jgi:flagellar protein FliO/FliZ
VTAADDLAVLGRVTLALVVVVALAMLAARAARRAGVRGAGAGLRVVDRTGLTREASIAVVEIAGRGLVLGVTARGVTLLTELDPDQLAEATTTAAAAVQRGARSTLAGGSAGRPRRGIVARTIDGGFDTTEPTRRTAVHSPAPGGAPGTGSVLDPRTWRQTVEALRDLTARRR